MNEPYRPLCPECSQWLDFIYHIWWRCRVCNGWWARNVETNTWEQSDARPTD